ncbi:glycosyltransferase family 4 protein [Glycomyces sp. A-F 0318]|uniref:glycosyltransferase family 4 protein n=1 Tax=Glycomyces amatae TaxID=2881355 RepID=UPI001E3D44D6|nr:glycosyltransferase family 4 protein [Glycomyces amatae]MCD0443725.1 glycosyltransferase family 4 protein [Glycomyces amatae]
MGNPPGRIVMLVQNGVVGDSRVQKEAASAAAAGWEVTLLGRTDGKRVREWELGGAAVRLVPTGRAFDRRRHEVRRAWLRSPLAYPPGPLEEYRRRQVSARRADIADARARLAAETRRRGAAATALPRAALAAATAAAGAAALWTRARVRASRRVREARAGAAAPVDRLAFRFWKALLGDRAWRRLDPALWELELAFGPVIDRIEPDLIHANDFQMLGVGARAKSRARAAGRDVKLVWDAHEFLPGMKPWKPHPWWHAAQLAHEREYAPYADAVVTVSEPLADLLVEEHGLTERPAVVMNTPDLDERGGEDDEPVPDLREQCGVEKDTPLMVYSGVPLVQRGIHIMVEALPALPDVHAALVVSKPQWQYVRDMAARAEELGVADRVHILPHVPHHQVVEFVSAADIGVSPNHHHQNHEISLNTKFFDYSHARLPMVVSDVKTIAAEVRRTGQGEVFRAEDTEDFVRAVKQVLAEPERYRAAYRDRVPLDAWTWRRQSEVLAGVYEGLIGRPAVDA